jgi:ceramide glucosyltransferase
MHALPVLETIFGIGAACGFAYYTLCLVSARKFLNRAIVAEGFAPPVTILKPLKGTDPGMYQSFRSHCLQAYPEYEIIFGVSDANDPALELVRRLQSEFPRVPIRIVVCTRILGTNVKVSNLVQMLDEAIYEHVVVNDSDIRVPADYLRRVVAPLGNPKTGLVTCLYRGVPGRSLGSRLEAIGIETDFMGGVLAAGALEHGIHFALGSTLAFSKKMLREIGGLEPLLDYLADDYELGLRVAASGRDVELSDLVVETHLPEYGLLPFFRHQLRWARTVRDKRRWGYAGLLLTFGVPWALLTVMLGQGSPEAWLLLLIILGQRTLMAAYVCNRVLQDRRILRELWLIPLRDIIALLVWIASFTGHTVSWRGDSFRLKNGKLVRINP